MMNGVEWIWLLGLFVGCFMISYGVAREQTRMVASGVALVVVVLLSSVAILLMDDCSDTCIGEPVKYER